VGAPFVIVISSTKSNGGVGFMCIDEDSALAVYKGLVVYDEKLTVV